MADKNKERKAAGEQASKANKETVEQTANVNEEPVKQEKDKPENKPENSKKDNLKKTIDELNAKLAKEKDDYLRLMAEFETYRRRSAEDRINMIGSASADTIKGLLPVLDDCERAISILASSSDDAAKEGTSLIYNKLMEYLKTRGLAVIEAKGQKFDVDFHEAVTQFPAPSDDLKGMVIDVIQTGYTLNGKVLRYAKVVVGV